jgi:hypothetical protein
MPITVPLEKVNKIIKTINTNHNTNYELTSQFDTGEWGAYRLSGPGQKSVVLKFYLNLLDTNLINPDPNLAKDITDHLRSLNYPTPKHVHSGKLYKEGLYWIQEELPGKPLWNNPTVDQVKNLLTLLKLQKNQAVSEKQNLSELVKLVVFENKFGKAAKLKNYSRETSKLLKRALQLTEGIKSLPLPNNDIVHGDFSYHQAMVKDDKIVGIIDWQETGCGDWLIDLTRLVYSLHDRLELSAPLITELKKQDSHKVKLYTAYTVLEMVSWPIHRHKKMSHLDR